MTHPAESRIRTPSDAEVCQAIKDAFPGKTDEQVIAILTRMIVFVAVCYNDIAEEDQSAVEVFDRRIFVECEELAEYFPWPDH